ncbi:MAG: hypothetical protein ICV65_19270, partial [Flavisolibacter sp.]|nr:hypothetical protein [Flavisolibacter sp.]
KGFNLPLVLRKESTTIRIIPSEEWQSRTLNDKEAQLFDAAAIEKMYYVTTSAVQKK